MQAWLADTWESVKAACFTSEFAKSPAAGIMVGVVLLLIKDRYDRHQSRRTLLRALHTEARTTWTAIHDLLKRFPKRADATAIVDGIESKTLTFKVLDELPAGWTLLIPSFPLADTISKLKPKEAEAAIAYFDAWTRLSENGRHAGSFYMKLVDLTPNLKKPEHEIQLLEVATQVRGAFGQLLRAAQELARARETLENVTARSLSRNPLVLFRPPPPLEQLTFPTDWERGAESAAEDNDGASAPG